MGIKLSDFIKDPHNVFTKEEAEMIYLTAGYVDLANKLEEEKNAENHRGQLQKKQNAKED